MQSCHSSPSWSMSGREALVMQTAWNRSHAWQLYQQETEHHPCLKSFYDRYLSTSRTSEVYNLAWLLLCNQMPLNVLKWISVSFSKVGLSQKLQEKRDFINLFLRLIFFDLQQVYLTNRRLDHFNPTSWQLKQRELAVYFEGNGEQDTSQESKAGFDRCQLISRSY